MRIPLYQLAPSNCKRTRYIIEKCCKICGYPNKPQARRRGGHSYMPSRRAYNTWAECDTQDA